MADEAKCVAQFIQLLKNQLCDVRLGTVMEKNWALSVEQCWLQVLQFSVHLIHLLSILLGHSGFARIQKAVVDQTGSRPPNSDHNLFFLVQVWFRTCVGAPSQSKHRAGHFQVSYTIHFTLHIKFQSRNCPLLLHNIRKDPSKQ